MNNVTAVIGFKGAQYSKYLSWKDTSPGNWLPSISSKASGSSRTLCGKLSTWKRTSLCKRSDWKRLSSCIAIAGFSAHAVLTWAVTAASGKPFLAPPPKWCFFPLSNGNNQTLRRACSLEMSKDRRSCLALTCLDAESATMAIFPRASR